MANRERFGGVGNDLSHAMHDNQQLTANSTGSPVFPGFQNYGFYSLPNNNEPVNLSSTSSPSTFRAQQEAAPYTNHPSTQVSAPQLAMNRPLGTSASGTPPSEAPPSVTLPMPQLTMNHMLDQQTMKHISERGGNSKLPAPKLPIPALPRSSAVGVKSKSQTYPTLLPHPPALSKNGSTTTVNNNSRSHSHPSYLASSSPAIQAALNQPIIGRDRSLKHPELSTKLSSVSSLPHSSLQQQAPVGIHYLSQPPLQPAPAARSSSKPQKQVRRKSQNKHKSANFSPFQSIKSANGKASGDRFVMASQIAGTPLTVTFLQSGSSTLSDQFAPVSSPRSAMMLSQTGSGDNSLLTSDASNDAFKDVNGALSFNIDHSNKFAPIDLRRFGTGDDGFSSIPAKVEIPPSPRSVLEMRLYKKRKRLLLHKVPTEFERIPQLATNQSTDNTIRSQRLDQQYIQQLATTTPVSTHPPAPPRLAAERPYHLLSLSQLRETPTTMTSPSKAATTVTSTSSMSSTPQSASGNSTTEFDWTSYLKFTNSKAAPHSAFKHVESSLINGFMVGMKVETPLRDVDSDKYWLATIVAVYGPMLKLRFDGYGDKSKDFTMICSAGQLHPIGWCARNQKSLLPPADIRHTQRQWKNFLLNALQGAKTIPTYLLGSRGAPWVLDRIRQGMRLEVQHEKLPTAVWVAKVIRNVGGRIKLRYEGSIDDATDFWLFYLDRRIRPCGWAVESRNENKIIYKPPDEIRAAYMYEGWSKILQDVTRDSTIERIPPDIFQFRTADALPHTLKVGQVLEAIHPLGTHIGPARIASLVDNSQFFIVEMIDGNQKGITKCCQNRDPTLFPVGWCAQNNVKLGKPEGLNESPTGSEFTWATYLMNTKALPIAEPHIINHRTPLHQFAVGQRLEAVNPSSPGQICVASIVRITGRLMWLDITTSSTATVTIIADVTSQCIFPSGWCESNKYPLTSPLVNLPKPVERTGSSSHFPDTRGEMGPKIYFNRTCFSGPFLSKRRILDLPEFVGPEHVRLTVKEMLNSLISVGYKSSYILKTLQMKGSPNLTLQPQIMKTKSNGKSYEGVIEVCTKRVDLPSYCRRICKRLKCCPNLVSTERLNGQCTEHCYTLTKTQFLMRESRKPGRPSSTNPDGSKKRKRKRRKKVFTPRRNLYIPKYTGASSDNDSGSSNSEDDDLSPAMEDGTFATTSDTMMSRSPVRPKYSPVPPSRTPTSFDDREGDNRGDNPLWQLQLTSVKRLNAEALDSVEAQYQIVKRKRGRPSKQQSPEALSRSKSCPLAMAKRFPTVPPLKIRRLELSPTPQSFADPSSAAGIAGESLMYHSVSPLVNGSALLNGTSPSHKSDLLSVVSGHPPLAPRPRKPSGARSRNKSSKSQLLLKAAVPHTVIKSALSFTQSRLHIDEKDKVILTDNPLYWSVSQLLNFIRQTDCAYLSDKISETEMDGQAFMMLVLPTAQEELNLKLGPALKLCHHVQRLKLAFFETFHPEEGMREIRQED